MSRPKLSVLPSRTAAPDVVPILERMLARARTGDVVDVVIVGWLQNGNFLTNYSANASFLERVGALDFVRARMMREALDDCRAEK